MTGQAQPTGLLHALLAVQKEAPKLPKDAKNPHFKNRFTSLAAMVETVGPILAEHGLVWTTLPCRDADGSPALRYRLAHVSGEVLEDVMPLMLTKQDPQAMGSAITYARRYSLAAVLNLVADEDDDGNGARRQQEPPRRPQAAPEPSWDVLPPESEHQLSQAEVDKLIAAKREAGVGDEWIRGRLVAIGVEDVPAGPVTLKTIRSLTTGDALALLEAFAMEIGARDAHEAYDDDRR